MRDVATLIMKLPKPVAELLRLAAGNPQKVGSSESAIGADPNPGYESVGAFTPSEAKALLDRLHPRAVRFQLGCDTSAGGVGMDGTVWDRHTVEILVHPDDFAGARDLVNEWRLAIGGISHTEASRQATEPLSPG